MDDRDRNEEKEREEANSLLTVGASIGVIGAISFAIAGVACPVCVVATPALLGIGAVKRLSLLRRRRACSRRRAPS